MIACLLLLAIVCFLLVILPPDLRLLCFCLSRSDVDHESAACVEIIMLCDCMFASVDYCLFIAYEWELDMLFVLIPASVAGRRCLCVA